MGWLLAFLLPLLVALLEELPIKRAVAMATRLTNIKKNQLYDLALEIQGRVRDFSTQED